MSSRGVDDVICEMTTPIMVTNPHLRYRSRDGAEKTMREYIASTLQTLWC